MLIIIYAHPKSPNLRSRYLEDFFNHEGVFFVASLYVPKFYLNLSPLDWQSCTFRTYLRKQVEPLVLRPVTLRR